MAIQIDSGKPDFGDQSPIVGIDLGTTNSLVAIVRDGAPVVLESREGSRIVPSVVSLIEGKPVVGHAARSKKVRDAAHTVFSAKRLLGRGFADVEKDLEHLPYKVVAGEGIVRIAVGEQAYTAIEISAMILRELKSSAEQALGTKVERAVITVPAYFNDSQRQATRAAGRLAGLDVLRIINEPTAAALAYGLDKKRQGLIAVYDLGGGTFDLSILRLHDGIFEVLATHGDTALGGDDLDRALASVAGAEIKQRFGADPASDIQLLAALLEAAEATKIALGDAAEATLAVDVAGKRYERRFTRQEFEALARPILERTREPCLRALADAGLKPADLTDVVMVGGPTRLKIVQEVARSIFGREINASVHPDEVVAAGAAIQADILAGNNKDFLLLDVVPLSLGIETYGGLMTTIIPRNTRIPAVAKEHYTTFVDNQTAVDIHVLQGERERVEDNRSLARFKLRVDPMPAGMARVQVNFLIDADGILQVAAKDLLTGNEQSVEVRPSFGLTDDQVEKMLMDTMEHAEEDFVYRRFVNVRNEAETVLRNAEKNLPAARRLLPPEEALRIEQRVIALKAELSNPNPPDGGKAIQAASKALTEASLRLQELLIKDAIASAGEKG